MAPPDGSDAREPGTCQPARVDVAVAHGEDAREPRGPGGVRARTVLARVALDRGDGTDVGREPRGLEKRLPRTRQVLDTQEHPELLRGDGHEERLGLPLARLER